MSGGKGKSRKDVGEEGLIHMVGRTVININEKIKKK